MNKICNLLLIMGLLVFLLFFGQMFLIARSYNQTNLGEIMMKDLTALEKHVIIDKGTEPPFTGIYNDHFARGIYSCRQCGAALFTSDSKFPTECGWPGFDDAIADAVVQTLDPDGVRTEITCARCGGHLGHVFTGEKLTPKNTRHCVNSVSLDFIPAEKLETAVFASGCFWGVQHHLNQVKGVYYSTVGYTGGRVDNPTYKQVCNENTGHAEAVMVVFDPNQVSYEDIAKIYFETHDPTQVGGQGPDLGDQYRSEIFYLTPQQKATAENLIQILKDKGYKVQTKLTPAQVFWPAEDYHQHYYNKTGKLPYCHIYQKKF